MTTDMSTWYYANCNLTYKISQTIIFIELKIQFEYFFENLQVFRIYILLLLLLFM